MVMAARPAKRKRTTAVHSSSSSSDDKASAETQEALLPRWPEQGVHPETLSLPSRTRSGKTRVGASAAKQPVRSPQKPKRPKQSGPKPPKARSIQTFFPAADEERGWTQDSQSLDGDELDDAIQDDAATLGEIDAQNTQRAPSIPGNGWKTRSGASLATTNVEEKSAPNGSQKFKQAAGLGINSTGASTLEHRGHRPWTDQYVPTTLDELAVHKKKVDDVRTWLASVFEGRSGKRVLILKGASGTGKTTTVSLLAQKLNVSVLEWQNPSASELSSLGYISVLAQFDEFINRSARFGSLDVRPRTDGSDVQAAEKLQEPLPPTRKKLILVEEFPNTFMSSSAPLHAFRAVIKQYLAQAGPIEDQRQRSVGEPAIPLVLIVSETLLSTSSSADNLTVHRLLGPDLLSHPAVSQIEFNPVARTLLTKALNLVLQKDSRNAGRRKTPGPALLERLGEVGDIRSALGSLEFLCLRDGDVDDKDAKPAVGKTKRHARDAEPLTKMEKESLQVITQREASLGMFHAVGKVVYNKRDEVFKSDASLRVLAQPPSYLSQHARKTRSQVAVDELMDQTGTDTQTFISALHENYIPSCYGLAPGESLDSVNGCIDSLSDSDLLYAGGSHGGGARRGGSNGAGKDSLRQDEISFQTAVRGILFSLPFPVKRGGSSSTSSSSQPKPSGWRKSAPTNGKNDAFKMFYPASLRLWRGQEEIQGIVDLWIKRSNEGLPTYDQPPNATKSPATTLLPSIGPRANPTTRSPSTTAITSGISGRSQTTLETLPYTAMILKASSSTPLIDIDKVTVFGALDIHHNTDEHSDFDEDDVDVDAYPAAHKQQHQQRHPSKLPFTTLSDHPPTSLRLSSLNADDHAHEALVLSDDDIEDES